jgi:Fe2+ or Zn2+ uptake regulation protein
MLKYSKQREAIIRILQSTDTHPTAEWIYEKLREEFPKASLATVYRNLKTLTGKHLVREIYTDDSSRFDANMSEHYHFMCRKCKKVIDVMGENTSADFSGIKEKGFQVDNYELSIYGVCPDCRAGESV